MNRVLIIEDNQVIRENTSELLEMYGYHTFVAENGNKGLEMAEKHLPDLIVCDVKMPGTDGFEVIQHLKATLKTMKIPVIFCSASMQRSEISLGIAAGAADYLVKPFDEEELLNSIRKCLGRKTDSLR